jgi:hypothetical protein
MIITLATMLTGLSGDVRKNSYLESHRTMDWRFTSEQVESKFEPFLLESADVNIRLNDFRNLYYDNISNKVKSNTLSVLDRLSSIFIDNVTEDSFYPSSYGTIIIEFEKKGAIFSLEIGKNRIGYFSEIDGKTVHFQEEVSIDNPEHLNLAIGELNDLFFDFYSKI